MIKILWDIVVQPLVYLIELVFSIFWQQTGSAGFAIICVSIAVNLLCLPLYKMADDAQERERARQAVMKPRIDQIRKAFRGDERVMVLGAYYRERGYKPVQALVGSLTLLLQIPFFMAAYSYLSNLALLHGRPYLFLADLSLPDGLIQLGGLTLNLLPILMTVLNCAATAVYTRGLPLRDKVQAYGLAAVFLVLLYDSPSGLVFYWTCNQVFSLGKNIVLRILRTRAAKKEEATRVAPPTLDATGPSAPRSTPRSAPAPAAKPAPARPLANPVPAFVLAGVLLTVLLGVLIPSAVMADSPTEFVDTYDLATSPLSHIVHTTCVWGGFWLLWVGIFFWLSSQRARQLFACVLVCLTGVGLVDYFCFGQNLGTISHLLVFDADPAYPPQEIALNLLAIAGVTAALVLVWWRLRPAVVPALAIVAASLVALATPNLLSINNAYATMAADARREHATELTPVFQLSRTERNVVVVFLDRAISGYLPYIMAERPELAAKFDGFTYYPNTLSFGQTTNFAAPALYGGYEYAPAAMNARTEMDIPAKHNEALLVLPTIFSRAGMPSVVTDPPYAGNYGWYADLSLYDQVPGTTAVSLSGKYTPLVENRFGIQQHTADLDRSFVFYGAFKALPEALQPALYDGGDYLSTSAAAKAFIDLMADYATLFVLPELTEVTDGAGSFIQMENTTTHEPDLLQLPDYLPAPQVDNTGLEDMGRFTLDGRTVVMRNRTDLAHYHANAGALLRLGTWFDWMREQGVYDNTRIIIVSDHGRDLRQFEGWGFDAYFDLEMVNPLFMVKDFDAHGFTTSEEFMTNADTPALALAGVVEDARNPFTGAPLSLEAADEAKQGEQLVTASFLFRVGNNRGVTFNTSDAPWYAFEGDDIFDLANWRRVGAQ